MAKDGNNVCGHYPQNIKANKYLEYKLICFQMQLHLTAIVNNGILSHLRKNIIHTCLIIFCKMTENFYP